MTPVVFLFKLLIGVPVALVLALTGVTHAAPPPLPYDALRQ